MDVDVLFGDASETESDHSHAEAVLSRLDAEEMTAYLLTCREGAGLRLTLCAQGVMWRGELKEAELGAMAAAVSVQVEEFTSETERALTRRQLGEDDYVYSLKRSRGGMELAWKRHIVSEGIKFQLGSVNLETHPHDSGYRQILEHSVSTTLSLQSRIEHLEEENGRLCSERKMALSRLERCVGLKEELEGELYSKFKNVLNEKKAKIRQLMEQLRVLSDENKVLQEKIKSQGTGQAVSSSPSSIGTGEGGGGMEKESSNESSPQHRHSPFPSTAPHSLLGEAQEVVSPPVKRRRREAGRRGELEIPRPPSITRQPPRARVRVEPEQPASAESDELLELL